MRILHALSRIDEASTYSNTSCVLEAESLWYGGLSTIIVLLQVKPPFALMTPTLQLGEVLVSLTILPTDLSPLATLIRVIATRTQLRLDPLGQPQV